MCRTGVGWSELSHSVSNVHLVATLQQALSFGAAVRRVPGPCLLITTNWVNAEMISVSLPFHSLPPQRQLRDTERSKKRLFQMETGKDDMV